MPKGVYVRCVPAWNKGRSMTALFRQTFEHRLEVIDRRALVAMERGDLACPGFAPRVRHAVQSGIHGEETPVAAQAWKIERGLVAP